ncbi:metalloprotease [Coemansia aciculifera]|nr:metalloprotease [Coemansia aciculifera]
MQQWLVEMTDEHFNSQLQTIISRRQRRAKNIDEEAAVYLIQLRNGTYDFNLSAETTKLLQSFTRNDVLEFWNSHFNPSSAPTYTRVDVQMWSTKIWKPTINDLKQYSAKTVGVFGCLHSEGNDALDIGKVDEFIKSEIAACNRKANDTDDSTNSLVEVLKKAGLSESGASYTVGESEENAFYTATALELAIKDHATFGNYSQVSRTNFATIGMSKTPDGMWLLEDYKWFQTTQQLFGLDAPVEKLVPKYND